LDQMNPLTIKKIPVEITGVEYRCPIAIMNKKIFFGNLKM